MTSVAAPGTTTFTFDSAGNQQIEQAPTVTTTNIWNYENQRTQVLLPSGQRETMTYNADFRMKRPEGLTMPETNFFWDPLSDNILQERDEAGVVTAEYTTEPGLYGSLVSQNRGGAESQYHFDAIGSTLALTDDDQQVSDTYAYTAFGEVTEHIGSTVNPYRYIGHKGYYHDVVSEGYTVRLRQYMPIRGVWLSRELFLAEIFRPYVYCLNAAVQRIDPSGQMDIKLDFFYGFGLCGTYASHVTYQGNSAPVSAWYPMFMVQHVSLTIVVSYCDKTCDSQQRKECDTIVCREKKVYCDFYEVSPGREFTDEPGKRLHDRAIIDELSNVAYSIPGSCPNTTGEVRTRHDIRVFSDRDGKVREEISKWKCGEHQCESGPRISVGCVTSTAPTFWNHGTIIDRGSLTDEIRWNCCTDPPTQSYTLTAEDDLRRSAQLVSKKYPGDPVFDVTTVNGWVKDCGHIKIRRTVP